MYYSPVPTLVIRADTLSLVCINGALAGECSASAHLSVPVSDNGSYYITVSPLFGAWRSITRKLTLVRGDVDDDLSDDVAVCIWPGGVIDMMLYTGAYIDCDGADDTEPVTNELALALAFAQAVRCENESGAMALLVPELAEKLSFGKISEFLGEFADERAPFSDRSGATIGLISYPSGSVSHARLFELEYDDGLISNVKEV